MGEWLGSQRLGLQRAPRKNGIRAAAEVGIAAHDRIYPRYEEDGQSK